MIQATSAQALKPYSVLLPLAPWEKPEILAEALASLKAQTWPASQVVVSCDGEPPVVLHAVMATAQLPLEILVGPGGEGVGPVLARGLLHCREDLVLRADADDWSLPERAALQVHWMLEHPQVVVMGTPINEFQQFVQEPLMQRWVPMEPLAIARMSRFRNPLNHPSVILRRKAVLAAGSYQAMNGFEDYQLWLRLLVLYGCQALANISKPLVMVRVGRAHLNRRHGWRYVRSEAIFLWTCGCSNLLPWPCVVALLICRLPLRLIPPELLAWAMVRLTRRSLRSVLKNPKC
jgi:cellulose synthase/poly-beta-1,6-N-acetylglucosamine synthase-like glycosyltransferase